jgi:tripartite-type tricarboxylate transporter receptor subunit TctC
MQRRQILLAAGGALLARGAAAAGYPTRPITLIVPYGPGGGVGINARAVQPYLEKRLDQTIIVDFKPGAGGIMGFTLGAHARPDGYTLIMVTSAITAAPWLLQHIDYTPEDYSYIGQVTFVPNMLIVNADSPYHTLADLIAAMKQKPGELATGFESSWPSPDVAQVVFFARAGVQGKVVPGFSGGAERIASLLGNHLDFCFNNLNEALPLYQARRIRVLAISGTTRVPDMAEVPTFRELGYDVAIGVWRTLAGPKGLPDPIVQTVTGALKTALQDPALRTDFTKTGLSADYLDPVATRELVMREYQALGTLFTELGINIRGKT